MMMFCCASRRTRVALFIGFLAALIAGALLPRGVEAQAPVPARTPVTFVYLLGTDTLAVETVTIAERSARTVLAYRGQPRIEWEQTHDGQRPLLLSLNVFAAGSAAGSPPAQQVAFTVEGDTVVAEAKAGENVRLRRTASKVGVVPMLSQSVVHAALISNFARSRGLTTFPAFNTASGQTVDATLTVSGDTTMLTMAGLMLRTVWVNGEPAEITVPAQRLRAVRASGPVTLAAPPINYDAPADAPYVSEAVTIPTTRGYTLAGTLTRPKGSTARVPVVITISGSGPQERDSRLTGVRGYQIFRDVADTLGRRGIAVLRYDDRGVGESGGASSRPSATSVDFADDVLSVAAYLRTRPDIDGTRIALAGHSEGGIIAPIAATKDPGIKAIALMAGTGYPGRRVLSFQLVNQLKMAGVTSEAVVADSVNRMVAALTANDPWMRHFVNTDPIETVRLVKQPVLILQGDTDMQVTPDQADVLAAALKAGGNQRVALKHFPATNHLFLNDPSGAPPGYAALPDKHVRREVLGALADWLVTTLR